MVLTDVIHPAQGPFPMAYRGVLNPVALDRTQDFIIWYLDFIAPPMGFIAQSIFMYYCIAWGFNIFTRILLVRLVTKAKELWLLYWPPPTIDSVVFFQRLNQDTKFNGRSGIVKVPYSTNAHRVGVEIDDQIVYVKLKNLSSCASWKEQIEQSFFSGLTMARKGLKFICRRRIIYGAFYTSIVVASLSTSSLESILSASYFSFGHEDLTAVLDNSATAHIFHDKSMFTSYHPLEPSQSQVATIGEHTSSAAGIGSISVSWTDDDGEVHTFQLKNVLHFPKSKVNLISVTAFAKEFNPRFRESGGKDAQITTGDGHSIFVWDKTARTFEHPSSNLPELPLFPIDKKMMFAANVNHCNNICPCNNPSAYSYFGSEDIQEPTKVTNLKNRSTVSKKISWADAVRKTSTPPQSLSNAPEQIMSLSLLQEKFLRWHERCNHLSFSSMIRLAKRGILPKEFIKLEKNLPPCGSCLFGRQSRRPKKAKFGNPIRKPEHNYPGGGVSADQIISAQPGLVPQSSGNLTNKRITAVTVFVDHNSDFSYVVLMTECSGKETLRAKQEFEAFTASHGVRIAHYHADNGRFQESMFTDDVQLNAQTISFCGVNAHHQNGIVERHIRKITESSRTMLLHAERLWPEAISPILWPFAIKYAAHIHNNLSLNEKGKNPLERFSSTNSIEGLDISDFHTFGSPCFVLDTKQHTPKWDPRSSLRIFVGFSPHHARNVAMVLNPFTGLVSPQYHVVFDDHFQTLSGLRGTAIPASWTTICKHNSTSSQAIDKRFALPALPANSGGDDSDSSEKEMSMGESEKPLSNSFVNLNKSGLRRSKRLQESSSKSYFSVIDPFLVYAEVAISDTRKALLTILHDDDNCAPLHYTAFFTAAANKCEEISILFDGSINKMSEFAFAANQQQNETYTFKDAMKEDDHADFIRAMIKEISDHENNGHWSMIERSSMPSNAKTILSIWSFKRKRSPSGELLKHKARLCAHGGMQKWGENYWETYSPTVSWMSVRALLAIGIIHDLSTSSVDFTLAFPQVDLDIDVFMELPIGCIGPNGDRKGHVLKLNKSLYGLKQASHNWFNYLADALTNRGFVQSQVDKCVWFKDGIVLLQYVDDLLIVGINDEIVSTFKKELAAGKENFVFTDGGPLDSYLGVNVTKHKDGSFELNQTFLIDKIIKTIIGDEDILHESNVPAVKDLLHKDTDGPDRNHDFNYRQAVGMLTYLQGTTRPDIAMPVHQCARFSSNPKRSHERAIIKIIRYLKSTKDKGIILKPNKSKGVECFVDASFASGWRPDDANNASNLLSRTGYIIYYASCPIHWCSKMQTEIALSTAEAEYIALSQAMRETIPFMRFMTELDVIYPIYLPKPKLYCKVFEDNEACISMATSIKFTPRTKHLALKYHHFRDWVSKGFLEVVHVPTTQQLADVMTKPLEHQLFTKFRYLISGW